MHRSAEDIIRDRYVSLRRQFHPGYNPNDAKTGADWDLAADIARGLGADPALFVDAQFHAVALNTKNNFPWPAQLHSSVSKQNYLEFISELIGSPPESKLQQQNTLLAAQLDGLALQSIDIALSKAILPFKSWFRILMCSEANLPKFRKVWGNYARQQVSNDQNLFEFLKEKYGSRSNRLL